MKRTTRTTDSAERSVRNNLLVFGLILLSLCIIGVPKPVLAEDAPKSFPSPEKAVTALIDAARGKNTDAIVAILGPSTKKWIISGDKVQDEAARSRFIAAYDAKHSIDLQGDSKAVLIVGKDGYPFAIPLVKGKKGWAFDPEQGREEILDRRIGKNELDTIQTLLAIVDAQREYADKDRNDNGLLEYAGKFRSSEGEQDGLYWPTDGDEPPSPLGELVVDAVAKGYTTQKSNNTDGASNPFHGYRFKLLKKQGADAPGGAYGYMVEGNMIGGFAVLAFPAKYDASGIMTFAVSHVGTVFQTDLGPETLVAVKEIDTFNPDSSWKKVDAE